jgi:hypothetical protein
MSTLPSRFCDYFLPVHRYRGRFLVYEMRAGCLVQHSFGGGQGRFHWVLDGYLLTRLFRGSEHPVVPGWSQGDEGTFTLSGPTWPDMHWRCVYVGLSKWVVFKWHQRGLHGLA